MKNNHILQAPKYTTENYNSNKPGKYSANVDNNLDSESPESYKMVINEAENNLMDFSAH